MIFERKDKAFWEFERRMALPPPPPPAERNAPALWTRARDMFAALMEHAFSLARLATRPKLRRPERREILSRLIPVEKLTRFLLTIEAVTWLLMTPEGARLRRSVRPAQAQPAQAKSKAESRLMPAPGWHTIAATHPRIDPRIAEREERERLAVEAASRQQPGDEDADGDDGIMDFGLGAADPASWKCSFHTRVDFDLYTDEYEPQPAPRRRATIDILAEDAYFPRLRETKIARTATPEPEQDDTGLGPGAALARRIEALARVLANPAGAVRRLARRLAAMPLDDLWPCEPAWLSDRWWNPARRDLLNAAEMFCRALKSLWQAQSLPPPEPG